MKHSLNFKAAREYKKMAAGDAKSPVETRRKKHGKSVRYNNWKSD